MISSSNSNTGRLFETARTVRLNEVLFALLPIKPAEPTETTPLAHHVLLHESQRVVHEVPPHVAGEPHLLPVKRVRLLPVALKDSFTGLLTHFLGFLHVLRGGISFGRHLDLKLQVENDSAHISQEPALAHLVRVENADRVCAGCFRPSEFEVKLVEIVVRDSVGLWGLGQGEPRNLSLPFVLLLKILKLVILCWQVLSILSRGIVEVSKPLADRHSQLSV